MRMWHCFKNNIKTEKHFNGKHYLCPALYKCANLNDNLSGYVLSDFSAADDTDDTDLIFFLCL